jgi:hypothetical protein
MQLGNARGNTAGADVAGIFGAGAALAGKSSMLCAQPSKHEYQTGAADPGGNADAICKPRMLHYDW